MKPRACARSGVPLYLLVDRVAEPATVTVLSRLREHGYERSASVPFGEALEIPEPAGITLDTGALRV